MRITWARIPYVICKPFAPQQKGHLLLPLATQLEEEGLILQSSDAYCSRDMTCL